MSLQRVLSTLTVVVVMAVILTGLWLRGEATPSVSAVSPAQIPPVQREDVLPTAAVSAPDVPLSAAALPATTSLETPAAVSMSAAREQGDARAPAVVRDAPRSPPTTAELADPEAYQRYEQSQHQRLQRAYVKAADTELPRLEADIARARAEGLPDDLIREGEEKQRRIQAMRDALQTGLPAQP